ncbi:response regulator transcription factor [Paraburkholderia antibiotica]|uniref:Response regulator transcription factor n=1 Tax=Paraburkholderia antibiotica TaxID=2728839 RepID=A0A7X9X6Z9_9BURK|nr:response regulator transcription factor [Paraburkholderia antibiotica]NML32641.1 response regulator transcription factor [Paraburkholderia antibiotica]
MRVAVLQHDPVVRQSIQQVLARAGHFCSAYEDGVAMSRSLCHSTMDLVMLDWHGKRLAGAELLRSVRQVAGERLPVMFVSSDASEERMVRALAEGADDYFALPLRAGEFCARVTALLRRAYPERFGTAASFDCGPYHFDLVRARVTLRGERVRLSPTQYRIAALFFSNVERVMSRDHIFAAVWGHEQPDLTRTVDSHVSRLRGLLEIEPRNGFLLQPVYRSGYRLLRFDEALARGSTGEMC